MRENDASVCQWHETAHACNGVVNSTSVMLLFRQSIFCPAPAGDSITRKSIFDALVAGCIPVLFSRASLSQYSWHVPEEKLKSVSVYIPMTEISENNRNFIDILKAIPADDVLRMQKNIETMGPSLQYSVIPSSTARNDLNRQGAVWSPPFSDAASVIIEKIVDRGTVSPIEGYSNEALLDQHHKQKEIMEYHEDFAALRSKNLNAEKQSKKLAKKVTTDNFVSNHQSPVHSFIHSFIIFVRPLCLSVSQVIDAETGLPPRTLTKALQLCKV